MVGYLLNVEVFLMAQMRKYCLSREVKQLGEEVARVYPELIEKADQQHLVDLSFPVTEDITVTQLHFAKERCHHLNVLSRPASGVGHSACRTLTRKPAPHAH